MSGEVKDFIKVKEAVIEKAIITEVDGDLPLSHASAPSLLDKSATSIIPNIVFRKSDDNSGLGGSADAPSIIAGGVEAVRYTELSSAILKINQSNVGLTADSGSAQGDGPITSSYNVYDTVGTAGDAATLPAVFPVGTIVYIKNGAAANSMDVFPATGDDLGQGANNAEALAAGDFAVFIGTTANSVWEKLMGGTA